ncbi:hypothetical protein BWI93_19165 [Siphonobacter sp. BAB-5385]|uniref:hypothetical protein n=1 Tax=Siphonobacter sp. BAB-5385 TaxID=1864822 RepID=UPI000B9E03FF|nr:hypothetical protein [Siphonobacter sp. BAB-5385]OZI06601.1 hypothetical protein BWI93_19165 [Siphonobacter sp. BAB-5385]
MELLYYKSLASFAGAALCVAALIYLQVKPSKINQKKINFQILKMKTRFLSRNIGFCDTRIMYTVRGAKRKNPCKIHPILQGFFAENCVF